MTSYEVRSGCAAETAVAEANTCAFSYQPTQLLLRSRPDPRRCSPHTRASEDAEEEKGSGSLFLEPKCHQSDGMFDLQETM